MVRDPGNRMEPEGLDLRPSRALTALNALFSVLAAAALWLSGLSAPLEQGLQSLLFDMRRGQASGELVIVEMDAASLAAIRRWPWDRRHYARVLEKLDAAGVRSIAFDVDFSTPSNPASDAALAQSLSAARGHVILPTFGQQAAHGSPRVLDALPIAPLRQSATLASVSVVPDADGQVRRLPLGTVTGGLPRPSLSAQIAGRGGSAGRDFPLDRSIDPGTIPRLSFIDVERGEFDPSALRGRDVIVGATALELGDRYAVPGHGALPGVVVQAIGVETLRRGVPVEGGGAIALLFAALWGLWLFQSPTMAGTLLRFGLSMSALVVLWHACWGGFQALLTIAPGAIALTLVAIARLAFIYRQEERFRQTRDTETGLPNRRAMSGTRAAGDFTIAAAIGNFERLHAVLGEAGSAELVRKLAERIAMTLDGSLVYRLDDRVLAWSPPASGSRPEQVLAGLSNSLRKPVEVAGRHVDAHIAFGIASAGAAAEAALAAIEASRNGEQWRYHEIAERAALEQQVSLMGELDAAIDIGELEVVYQPQLHLASNRIDAVEALVRWNHPERGYLRPDAFIPLAEEADRIDDLTLFVLARTIEDLRDWCARDLVLRAAVNISARLLSSPRFMAAAEAIIAGTGVPRHRLIFEVTESAAFCDSDTAVEALEAFRAMGIEISMDDYGTGQSTLSYLKRLPLAELKIDRSFVQFAHRDRSDALLVRSTLNLAHELGLRVVAEGVEDPECLEFLREINCDYAQGYLIGKPLRAAELEAALRDDAKLAA